MSTTTETDSNSRKLRARIGAEIRGLDLGGDLSRANRRPDPGGAQ